ncbi:glycosyltransferase [Rhizobium sp. C1]|nr:glycosyltransferase [Rhizobium sp. C1]
MRQISICMPSNRGFEKSFRAIETALAFCEARDAMLIVSDNSRDAEKAAYWQGRSRHLCYLADAPLEPNANAMNTFAAVETPFLMPIGDDDELHADDAHVPVDLAALAPDVIGVKPVTELFIGGTDIAVRRAFELDAQTPGLRLRQFFQRNEGDNTAFYSIFRTAPYMSLRTCFLEFHPTRGGYCDWPMSMALFMSGKLLLDRSIVFRYNAEAWATRDAIDESEKRLYASAGLPENFHDYSLILRAMDLFVFSARKNSGLTRDALAEVQSGELCDLFNQGFAAVLERVGDANRLLAEAARKGGQERNPMLKFLHGATVLDCFQPGLKAKYIAFLKSASV